MLFDAARHEPLCSAPWSEQNALAAIAEICADAERCFETQRGWPTHPLDLESGADGPRFFDLYFGAAGVIWALDALARRGEIERIRDYATELPAIVSAATAQLAAWYPGHPPAFLLGDLGARLVQAKLAPSQALADELYRWLSEARRLPTREMMWGAPGVVLALTFLLASDGLLAQYANAHGQRVGMSLLQAEFDAVLADWKPSPIAGVDLWQQDLYGRQGYYLDSVHGSMGNVHALLRAAQLLGDARATEIARRGAAAACALARVEADEANWHALYPPPAPQQDRPEFLVHYCHGAPGFVICLDPIPNGRHPELDTLLLRAGQLVWNAGPLRKGPNLCHGTAGNGYAFLKLWNRTGQAVWLERARAFAMHAIEQVQRARQHYGRGRYALWTGDLGVALYLSSCIHAESEFPTLDRF